MAEYLQVFRHVGLLIIEPPQSGCSLFSHPKTTLENLIAADGNRPIGSNPVPLLSHATTSPMECNPLCPPYGRMYIGWSGSDLLIAHDLVSRGAGRCF